MKKQLFSCSLMLSIACIIQPQLMAADRYWIHKPYYENFFTTVSELTDWNIVEDNGSGNWALTGIGTALLTMDNAAGSYANRMFNVNGGSPRFLPLDRVNGRVEIMVKAITGGNQRIFVQVQQFDAANTYLGEFSLLPGQSATGFFSINLNAFSWDAAADKVRFIIGGENYSSQQGSVEFDYFSYSNGNGNWNNSANWSSVSNGAGGASVPGASDVAIFDGAAGNNGSCLLTSATSIAGLLITNGYSGNFDLQGYGFTIGTGGVIINGGGITGSASTISINGNVNISSGAYKNLGGDNYVTGDIAITGGVLDFSTGHLIFDAAGNQQFSSTTVNPIHKFIVNKPSGTVQLSSDILIADSLVLTQGIIQTNGFILQLGLSTTTIGKLIPGAGKVNGNFRQWISNSTTGDIVFPFGDAVTYAPVTVTISSAATTGGSITAAYNDAVPAFDIVNFMDGSSTIIQRSTANWNIQTSGIGGGSYLLTAANNHLATIASITDLHFTQSATAVAAHQAATGTLTNPVLHRSGLTPADLAQTWYASLASAAVLPLTWGNFTATAFNNEVLLKWNTLQEINTSHFLIEHSTDGISFTEIGTVRAVGNSTNTSNYTFTHSQPVAGIINYYRLKQIDADGRFSYSAIRTIKYQATNSPVVLLSSTMVTDEFKITSSSNNILIRITDMKGSLITNLTIQAGPITISSNRWPTGTYQLTVFEKNKLIQVQRLIKL